MYVVSSWVPVGGSELSRQHRRDVTGPNVGAQVESYSSKVLVRVPGSAGGGSARSFYEAKDVVGERRLVECSRSDVGVEV
jgi:hypothetical protein